MASFLQDIAEAFTGLLVALFDVLLDNFGHVFWQVHGRLAGKP